MTDVYISLSTDWWSLSAKLFIQNQNFRMRTMKMCQWFSYLAWKGDNLYLIYSIIIYVYIFKWIAIWRVIDLAPDTHMDELFELKSNYVWIKPIMMLLGHIPHEAKKYVMMIITVLRIIQLYKIENNKRFRLFLL